MRKTLFSLLLTVVCASVFAQKTSPFDFGKMWTFENPPIEWFKEAYDMDVDQAWFDDVRKSSLRFASWCSASFVSPDGLIMTNHHCSRSVVYELQKEGENFDEKGFYATTRGDERKAEGLFVEQLIQVDDITSRVKDLTKNAENDADRLEKIQEALDQLTNEYAGKDGWEGLRLETVTYYSGGKFSMYGYKRYDDIRLVLLPEMDLGYYGGDPDNFTYPRYNLDCTFWRAYDENGDPVNSSAHFFRFNPEGISEGTPVFVIGNPGSTERYRTVSQLEYDRDFRYPVTVTWMQNRYNMLYEQYEKEPSDELMNTIFSLSNSLKAMNGILDGLEDPELFNRKVEMEKYVRSKAGNVDYWDRLTDYYNDLGPKMAELQLLSPNPIFQGKVIAALPVIHEYMETADKNPEDPSLEELKGRIMGVFSEMDLPEEKKKLALVLDELMMFTTREDAFIHELLDDRAPLTAASEILDKSVVTDPKKLEKYLDKPKKAAKGKDEIFRMAEEFVPKYQEAVAAFQGSSAERNALEEKIANEVFKVYGDDLPPDATFTLRISDGVVKGYAYNGTEAPYMTTYFGLYDRHFSHQQEYPWSLPEKWMNPPMELLKAPLNFVSTNDIIGGNSGSPVINQNKEAVGLIFDGNIESLPGNFIFDEESNRSVSVHAGGMIAAMRYIYKADRLIDELLKG